MATRWSTTFYDIPKPGQTENLWTVEILDMDALVDANIDFVVKADGLTISGQSEAMDWTNSIVTTKCSVTMIITGSATQDFIDDLIQVNEGRFWLRVKRNALSAFVGVIVVDGIVLQDLDYPFEFKFTAVDALSRLKDIELDANRFPGGSPVVPITKYIEDIFELTGISQIYTTGVPFIETYVEWTSQSFYDPFSDRNILGGTGIHYKAFNKLEGNNVRYSKGLDIIKSCLQVMGARIIWNFGTYTIDQFDYRAAQTSNMERFRYDSDMVLISNDTGVAYLHRTYDGETIRRLKGMTTTFLPPLRAARVVYEHEPFSAASLEQNSPYTVGTAVTGDDVIILSVDDRLLLNYSVAVSNLDFYNPSYTYTIKPILRFKIKVGSGGGAYYWRKEITGGSYNAPIYNNAEWSATESYVEVLGRSLSPNDLTRKYSGEIISATLTDVFTIDTSEALEVTLDSIEYISEWGGMSRSARSTNYEVNGSNLDFSIFPHDGNDAQLEKTKTYFSANGSTDNSKVLEIPLKVGEGPSRTSASGVWQFNGTDWVGNTEDWSRTGVAPFDNICSLLAESILAQQRKPTRVISATFLSDNWLPSQAITMDGVKYLCMSYTLNAHKQEVKGRWVELSYNSSGITKEKDEYITPGSVVTGGGSDPENPAANIDILVDVGGAGYYEKFSNVSASFVTTTTADVLPDPSVVSAADIRRGVSVFTSGSKRDYNVPFGYDIDFANDRVRFLDSTGTGYRNLLSEDVELTIKP
jgi:hypothetical protein